METGAKGPSKGGERWRAHGKCWDSDASSMQRVAGILKKKQLILMYTGYFTLDSPSVYLQTFISLPTVCACVSVSVCGVRACVCVCVCVNFYFSCHSLYLLFVGVFCSVCIIGESLIFLLSWKWMTFALLKNIIYKFCGFFLSDKLRLISLYEKGWNLKKKKTEGKDIKGIYHLVLAGHDGTGLYRLWNLRSKFVLFSLPEDFLFGDLSSVTFTIASLTLSWRTSTVWL